MKKKPRCKVCKAVVIQEVDGFLLGFCWCPVCDEFRDDFFGDAEMDRLENKIEEVTYEI